MKNGDRCGQDNRDGHADGVADSQCGARAGQQAVHARLPDRYAGDPHPRRLRVLQPNDPDSYYKSRELVPADMLEDINKAKIVITNYHGFQLRELMDTNKVGKSLLQGPW